MSQEQNHTELAEQVGTVSDALQGSLFAGIFDFLQKLTVRIQHVIFPLGTLFDVIRVFVYGNKLYHAENRNLKFKANFLIKLLAACSIMFAVMTGNFAPILGNAATPWIFFGTMLAEAAINLGMALYHLAAYYAVDTAEEKAKHWQGFKERITGAIILGVLSATVFMLMISPVGMTVAATLAGIVFGGIALKAIYHLGMGFYNLFKNYSNAQDQQDSRAAAKEHFKKAFLCAVIIGINVGLAFTPIGWSAAFLVASIATTMLVTNAVKMLYHKFFAKKAEVTPAEKMQENLPADSSATPGATPSNQWWRFYENKPKQAMQQPDSNAEEKFKLLIGLLDTKKRALQGQIKNEEQRRFCFFSEKDKRQQKQNVLKALAGYLGNNTYKTTTVEDYLNRHPLLNWRKIHTSHFRETGETTALINEVKKAVEQWNNSPSPSRKATAA